MGHAQRVRLIASCIGNETAITVLFTLLDIVFNGYFPGLPKLIPGLLIPGCFYGLCTRVIDQFYKTSVATTFWQNIGSFY